MTPAEAAALRKALRLAARHPEAPEQPRPELHPLAVGTPGWTQERGRGRAGIYNTKLGADGTYRASSPEPSPWCAYIVGRTERYFGSHAAAVRHLIQQGWKQNAEVQGK